MAASDPTTDVPTPTGTLQGVAAFSWDGANWQPTGRAGPSVATPTGVLRGVAAFNGGPAWQPSGRAQPGVATPTGTLDGVAVYTWSGSAWTPPGGQPSPSTPSGALRGVAAFNWDGSAWQPAGQAGPSVATPYGVLDGVAMFNWSGSAWAAVGAPSLSLDFMTPGTLDPRITFTRASTATYTNSAGVMQTAAVNAPRWDYNPSTLALNGLLIEEARTNLLFPSVVGGASWAALGAALAGSVTTPDGATSTTALIAAIDTSNETRQFYNTTAVIAGTTAYTVTAFLKAGPVNAYFQINATGGSTVVSVAYYDLTNGVAVVGADLIAGLTGRAASITAVGNGWYRCAFTFTTVAGNTALQVAIGTCTIVSSTGDNRSYVGVVGQGAYAWGAQVEQGAFPTSYIPTTTVAATRSADLASMPTAAWFNTTNGTYEAEFIPNGVAAGLPIVISGNAGSPTIATGADSRLTAGIRSGAAVFSATGPLFTFGAVNKAAFGYLSGASTAAVNGTTIGPGAAVLTVTGTVVEFGSDGVTPGNNALNGWLRRVRFWPRVLTNAELQSVTT